MAENIGHVIQVAGPAVDVQFSEAALPPIYTALRVTSEGFNTPQPLDVILEVEQQLGEGRVRCVAMEPTEGMVPGAERHRQSGGQAWSGEQQQAQSYSSPGAGL